MHDLLDDIDRWTTAGHRIAVARVVDIEGSGPREPGAAMAVTDDGEVAGEREPGVITFGYSDDEAFAVGLTCGGTIHLYIEELDW
jgi:xanthine dehydrogenase accessory factor